MIYEWAAGKCPTRAVHKIYDGKTGEVVRKVRYIDTETDELRRFALDADGEYIKEPGTLLPLFVIEKRYVRIQWQDELPEPIPDIIAE